MAYNITAKLYSNGDMFLQCFILDVWKYVYNLESKYNFRFNELSDKIRYTKSCWI